MKEADKTGELDKLRRQIPEIKTPEGNYRTIVEDANIAIIVIQNGKVRFANPKALRLFDCSKDNLIKREFTEFIHPKDRVKVTEYLLNRAEEKKNCCEFNFRINAIDTRWIEASSVLVVWKGEPAFLSFLTDVTERRKKQAEFLKNEKLESMGILAGGIAHDFNNILTGILGNISLAMMFLSPKDKAYERLTEAERASFRAKNLTQQLLTFSKGGEPILELTSVKDLLRSSVNLVLSGSSSRCDLSLPSDLYYIKVDGGQILQVLNNVIINADQSMPGGGTIKISAENNFVKDGDFATLKTGEYVKVSIEDHGIGILEEHLPKIFDPYFTTKQKGSGLGLAIAYSIIKKHGGYIGVKSKIGIGTTFDIYLPACNEKVEAKGDLIEKDSCNKQKILVMDDEEIIRDLVEQTLSNTGYEVILAADGTEAIELYRAEIERGRSFDALIMDLTVPGGMGGKEAIKKLLEIDPNVKVIVSSGYSNDPVMANFKQYGFKGVIAKPYKIKELNEVLQRVINE